jgi:alpha-L-fucosidase
VIDRRPRAAASATLAIAVLAHHAALAVDVAQPPNDTRDQVSFAVRPVLPKQTDRATQRALDRFNDARFALFIHWGIYAEAGGVLRGKRWYGASEWLMNNSQATTKEYLELARTFNPTEFDAREWIGIAKAAGVKYIVITAKHHDGFAMFASKASKNNIVDATPFKRDPLKELGDAAKAEGMGLGFYYSQYQDWTEPNGGGNKWEYDPSKADFAEYFDRKVVPQVTELLTKYGSVREIWFDTPGPMGPEYSARLAKLVKKLQPDCLLNSRIGNGFGDYTSPADSEVLPKSLARDSWEAVFTHNHSWGYSRFDNDFNSSDDLIYLLVLSASRGGNLMLNMGPDERGRFPGVATDRLLKVGAWLKVNGESIYATKRSPLPQMPWGVATQKAGKLYLHVLEQPQDGVIAVPAFTAPVTAAKLLDGGGALEWRQTASGLSVTLPAKLAPARDHVIALDVTGEIPDATSGPTFISMNYGQQAFDVADATPSAGVELQSIKTQLFTDDYRKFYSVSGLDDPSKFIEWQVRTDAPGSYHMDIEYAATTDQAGNEGWIEAADQRISFIIKPTAPIQRRQPVFLIKQPVGIVTFESPGVHTIRLRPDKAGRDLFTPRSLYVTPAR